jgi:SAM-dependent methyltransferase
MYKGAVYDLGCGEAIYKDFFLRYADEYIGVDWSDTLHNSKADIVADLNKETKIKSNVADTVISLSVMEHLFCPQTMLNEAARILKPNGKLVLQVPWQWRLHEDPYDYFRYTPYALEKMLKIAKFKDITIEAQSGFFTMIVLKFNYFTKRFVVGPKLMRGLISLIIVPIWFILQLIAPILDKLDRNWLSETTGYFVTATQNES